MADLGKGFGSEQGGFRPVVIIQNNVGNHYSPTVIVAALTSRVKDKARLPTHFLLRGLTQGPSLVLCEQLRTLDKRRLGAFLGRVSPREMEGVCVYCNHCQPCPAGLDIGLINKYFDLAKAGDALAADHYRHLSVKADSCIGCGHCNSRCPFHVDQVARMETIAEYFAD